MTLPIIAMLIVIMVGMAAFAVDLSRMYLFHAQLRTSAEAGALAGANRIIKNDGTHATDSAVYYAATNLVDKVAPDVGPADVEYGHYSAGAFAPLGAWNALNVNAVRVTTRHEGQFIFGRIYGQTRRNLQGRAIAVVGSVSRTVCVRPLAIPLQSLFNFLGGGKQVVNGDVLDDADIAKLKATTYHDAVILKTGDASLAPASGNFYAVRLPPALYANGTTGNPWSGGNAYRDALSAQCPQGLNIPVGVGDWLAAENGNMVGPTRQGLATACGVAPSSNFDCLMPEGLPMRVPIWDIADKSKASPNAFHVAYVGIFFATGFSSKGGVDGITGYFHSLAGSGTYDTLPGPLTKAVLRQ